MIYRSFRLSKIDPCLDWRCAYFWQITSWSLFLPTFGSFELKESRLGTSTLIGIYATVDEHEGGRDEVTRHH